MMIEERCTRKDWQRSRAWPESRASSVTLPRKLLRESTRPGFFVKLFYGNLFAYLKGFQAIVKQMQAVLWPEGSLELTY
jgi:hypothetical protein